MDRSRADSALVRRGQLEGLFVVDGDGLEDVAEVEAHTNPWLPDTDGDGCRDSTEYRQVASGLDPLASAEVKVRIERLKAAGRTVLLSSHLMREVDEIADDLAL